MTDWHLHETGVIEEIAEYNDGSCFLAIRGKLTDSLYHSRRQVPGRQWMQGETVEVYCRGSRHGVTVRKRLPGNVVHFGGGLDLSRRPPDRSSSED